MVVLAGSLGVMALLVGAGWIHWLASHRRISPLWWTAACTLAIGLAFLAWGRGYSEEISRQRKPEGWCDSCERLRELEVANRWGGVVAGTGLAVGSAMTAWWLSPNRPD